MGKDKTAPRFATNQAGATAKFLRVPPRKARLVIDAVRGKYVTDALAILKFVPNFAARAIEKVVTSAVSNAENGRPVSEETGKPLPPLIKENLRLVRAFVDEGPRMKRMQPRAQGRGYRILKRMCHISVIVEEVAPKPRPVRKQSGRRPAQVTAAHPATKAVPAAVKAAETAVEPEVEATVAAVAETTAVETAPVAEEVAAPETAVEQAEAPEVDAPEAAPEKQGEAK
jgi:large subunit ribosomal protein L22